MSEFPSSKDSQNVQQPLGPNSFEFVENKRFFGLFGKETRLQVKDESGKHILLDVAVRRDVSKFEKLFLSNKKWVEVKNVGDEKESVYVNINSLAKQTIIEKDKLREPAAAEKVILSAQKQEELIKHSNFENSQSAERELKNPGDFFLKPSNAKDTYIVIIKVGDDVKSLDFEVGPDGYTLRKEGLNKQYLTVEDMVDAIKQYEQTGQIKNQQKVESILNPVQKRALNEEIAKQKVFEHPAWKSDVTEHSAVSLLENEKPGTYLIRPSSVPDTFTINIQGRTKIEQQSFYLPNGRFLALDSFILHETLNELLEATGKKFGVALQPIQAPAVSKTTEEKTSDVWSEIQSKKDDLLKHVREKRLDLYETKIAGKKVTIINKKEIYIETGELGKGAAKIGSLAINILTGEEVALLSTGAGKFNSAIAEAEAEIMQKLKGKRGIAQLISVAYKKRGKDKIEQVLVVKYYSKGDLKSNLTKLSQEQRAKVGGDILEGLQNIHLEGYIYSDLKPDNILLDENGAVITDFGTAFEATDEYAGMIFGTQSHMSPNHRFGPKTGIDFQKEEVFEAALTLWQLEESLEDFPPWINAKNKDEMIKAIEKFVQEEGSKIENSFSPRDVYKKKLLEALSVDPEKRPNLQTLREVNQIYQKSF